MSQELSPSTRGGCECGWQRQGSHPNPLNSPAECQHLQIVVGHWGLHILHQHRPWRWARGGLVPGEQSAHRPRRGPGS